MNRHEDAIQPISKHLMVNSHHADATTSGRGADHEVSLPSLPSPPRRVAPRAILRDPRSGIITEGEVCSNTMPVPRKVRARATRRRFHPLATHLDEGGSDQTPSQQPEDMDAIVNSQALTDTEAKAFFDAIALKAPCVFLCLGPPENCRVIQVQVTDDDDDEKIFQAMKEGWSKNRKRMPFRKITRVQEVTFRFIGQEGTGTGTLVGTYEAPDTAQLHQDLQDELEALDEAASHWQGPDRLAICLQDYASGKWDHAKECASYWYSYRGCDIEDSERVQHNLRSLSLLPALTLAFHNPSLAKGQRLLHGLAQQGRGLYSTRGMLRNLYWHDPRIGDVSFNGYSVTEEWDEAKCAVAVIFVVISSVGSAAIFRMIFGDWQTAIAASSLAIAIIALVIQWRQGWSML
ncbi:hypothetical protein ACJZ2D_007142 [Fusarium nematophilum]